MAVLDKKIVAFVVSLALFMDALDTTVINTAIPAMSQSLNVNPVDLKVALISYLLSLAIFIPISGWVADKFGIKRVFIAAISLFTISSLACGYAQTLLQLIIARSIQGIGGSFMMPVGRLIILRTFQRHEVVTAMSTVIMVVSLGLMLGPFAGGMITYYLSWHWIFWINIPFGIFAILISAYWLENVAPAKVRSFDFLGFILFSGGLAGFTFALSSFSESDGNHQINFLVLIVALLMLVGYFLYGNKQRHPIINTELFYIRTFRIAIIGNLCARLGFGSLPFLLPLLLQVGLGYTPQLSGLLLVPIAFGILVVKVLSLRILQTLGYKRLLLINTSLVAISLLSFRVINITTPTYLIAFLTFLFGLLISLQYSGMNSLAYADVPQQQLSSATSIMSTMQQVSQSFGVAVAALLLRFFSRGNMDVLTPSIFHEVFFTMGILTFLSIMIFTQLKPNDGHQMLTVKRNADENIATRLP